MCTKNEMLSMLEATLICIKCKFIRDWIVIDNTVSKYLSFNIPFTKMAQNTPNRLFTSKPFLGF